MRDSIKRLLLAVLLATVTALSPVAVAEEPAVVGDLGLVRSEGDFPRLETSQLMGEQESLPPRVDLGEGLPPAGHQNGQASCVGWTLGYYYKTFQEYRERGWDISSVEHQFSPAWIYNQRTTDNCEQDAGMSYYDGLRILEEKGAATLASFPYDPNNTCTQPSPNLHDEAQTYRIDSFRNVFAGAGSADMDVLKTLLADGQPIAVGVPVYDSFFAVTRDDLVVPQRGPDETLYGGHAMLVVGYDDDIGGFKTMNSWGDDWGRDGYCYLSYDFMKHDAWEGWVMKDYVASEPSFYGEVTVDGQAAEGTEVTALIEGASCATTTTESRDGAAYYSLRIPMDDPDTPEKEGGSEGDVVSFEVGSTLAEETATWEPDASISRNLSVTTGAKTEQKTEYVFVPNIFVRKGP
ncbi:MAG: C1 family peptidase [Anaerolineales bacterium]